MTKRKVWIIRLFIRKVTNMITAATAFEATMIFCWGISWPSAVLKTYRTKNVTGVSIVFLWLIFAGYVSGICFKFSEYFAESSLNHVIWLYLFNFIWVAAEVVLYYKYRKYDCSAI